MCAGRQRWVSGLALALALTWSASLAAVEMDEDMAELAAMLRENCAEETGVDLTLVERINAGALVSATPDPKLKCYIKCYMETAGMLDEGEVDTEAVVELLPPSIKDKVADHIIACQTKKGGDDCETAYLTQICWQDSDIEHYFMI